MTASMTPQESPQPQGPQYGPPQPPPPRGNGMATAALVLGILTIVFAFIPVAGIFVAIPLGVIALGLGIPGLIVSGKRRSGRGTSIAGMVLAVLAFILAGVMTAAVFGGGDSGPSASQPVTASQPKAQDKAATAGIGDKVTDGNLTFTVTGVDTAQTVGEDFLATDAQGKFVIVNLAVENTGNESATFNTGLSQVAFDASGNKYETSVDAMTATEKDMSSFLQPINPGNSVEGRLVYDVPENVEIVKVFAATGRYRVAGHRVIEEPS